MQPIIPQDWQQAKADKFWAEIAPSDHVVQFYDTEEAFLQALAGFAGGGINMGESVVVIATPAHLQALDIIFRSLGVNTKILASDGRFIAVDAEALLARFLVNGQLDQALFLQATQVIMDKAKARNRKIRVFGEMVALLLEKGLTEATIELEGLWKHYCEDGNMNLFCAYPSSSFVKRTDGCLSDICHQHQKIINGSVHSMTEVLYRSV